VSRRPGPAAVAAGLALALAAFVLALVAGGGSRGVAGEPDVAALATLAGRWATTWGEPERGSECVVRASAAAARDVVVLAAAVEPRASVRVVVIRGRFAGTRLRPRARFDRLLLAVDDAGHLRGLSRRASAEVDPGLAALGPCRSLVAA
jgi:hypothetical protein